MLTRELVAELRDLERRISHGDPGVERDMKAVARRGADAIEAHLDALRNIAAGVR